MIYSVLPFVLCFIALIYWTLHKLIARMKSFPVGRTVASMVVMLFLIHPNIVDYMFKDFRCVDIDGDKRLLDDMQIQCWNRAHSIVTYYIAIPSMIVWGLGLPFFALIMIHRSKKNIDTILVREKWGFLFNGFKQEFYYWEIVIMFRKVIIIFISSYVTTFGVITQALILFLVLIFFTILTIRKRPYSKVVF